SPVANIFAVSGKIIGDCPILGTTTVEDLEATSAELNWTLSNAGAGSLPADVTYTVQLYSDAGHTMPVGDPIIVAGVTEHNITNLNTLTTYHYTIVGIMVLVTLLCFPDNLQPLLSMTIVQEL